MNMTLMRKNRGCSDHKARKAVQKARTQTASIQGSELGVLDKQDLLTPSGIAADGGEDEKHGGPKLDSMPVSSTAPPSYAEVERAEGRSEARDEKRRQS